MKKCNTLYLVMTFVILGILSCVLATLMLREISEGTLAIAGIFLPFILLIHYFVLGRIIYGISSDKLMDQLVDNNFTANYTFESDDCKLAIDICHGKIAYVSIMNPFQLQIVSAAPLANIQTITPNAGLGGVRLVRFMFSYQGNMIRVNTFTSRYSCSKTNPHVVEAIAKADTYCDALRQAQSVAQQSV